MVVLGVPNHFFNSTCTPTPALNSSPKPTHVQYHPYPTQTPALNSSPKPTPLKHRPSTTRTPLAMQRVRRTRRKRRGSRTGGEYKTELCNNFRELGKCPYEDRCLFAHGVGDLRRSERTMDPKYKTQKCRNYWGQGKCDFGKRCDFIHRETREQLRQLREFGYCIPVEHKENFTLDNSAAAVPPPPVMRTPSMEEMRRQIICAPVRDENGDVIIAESPETPAGAASTDSLAIVEDRLPIFKEIA